MEASEFQLFWKLDHVHSHNFPLRSEVAAYERDRACMCIIIIKTCHYVPLVRSKCKNKGLHIQIIDTGAVISLAMQSKNCLCHYKSKSLDN